MDVVVVDKVVEEVNKVVEEVNKVVEEVNKELVMDVVVEGVVDKEVTKVVVHHWWRRSTRSWCWTRRLAWRSTRRLTRSWPRWWRRSTRSWCWTRKLTWRSTRRLTRKWTMLSEEFEGPCGHYILEKGLLHVNYVLKRFLVETT